MTKIKSMLAYEGIKPPKQYGLFTKQGIAWLHTLNIDSIECYLAIMAAINVQIRNLPLELQKIAKDYEDVKLLMTIPGVEYYTALLVKAEVGDVNRFSTGEQLCSYAGIVPSTYSSSDVTRHGRITKQGSKWLRWAMTEAAIIQLKYNRASPAHTTG